jgi:hypothetical protein
MPYDFLRPLFVAGPNPGFNQMVNPSDAWIVSKLIICYWIEAWDEFGYQFKSPAT